MNGQSAARQAEATSALDIGFYYPGHVWRMTDWLKTMLLFFDGLGLLVPEYKKDHATDVDPVLAAPLRQMGLLHYMVADEVVDKKATEQLGEAMSELLRSGAFDHLNRDGTAFHEISMSRIGYFGDEQIATALLEKLKEKGLAKDSQDGASIPMHPLVRYIILTLLAQILSPQGKAKGLNLSPITDRPEVVDALAEVLGLPGLPSAGRVVAFDLQTVTMDLAAKPLDEVLSFRQEHLKEHRHYARSIRQFAREVSLMSVDDREAAFADRQAELDDLASDLRKRARKAWRGPASFALGLAGAGWNFASGNLVGGLLAGGALLAGGVRRQPNEAGAYSYLFSAAKRFA